MACAFRSSSRHIQQISAIRYAKGCVQPRYVQLLLLSKEWDKVNVYGHTQRRLASAGNGSGYNKPPGDDISSIKHGNKRTAICPNCSSPVTIDDHGQMLSSALCRECNTLYKIQENVMSESDVTDIFKNEEQERKLPYPTEIKEYLDRHVIGQERAKRILSSTVYNFYKMLKVNLPNSSVFDTSPKATKDTLSDSDVGLHFGSTRGGSNKKSKKTSITSSPPFDSNPYDKGLQIRKKNELLPVIDKDTPFPFIQDIPVPEKKRKRKSSIRWNKVEGSNSILEVLTNARERASYLGPHKKPEQEPERRGSMVLQDKKKTTKIDKSNLILIGPSGSGKTLMVQKLAKILDVPFATQDCTSVTQAGYVGEDIEAVISKLYNDANGSIEKTQQGIVYLDEVDKIARSKVMHTTGSRDVGGEGVQQGFLKVIEGTVVSVPVKNGSKAQSQRGETVSIDSTNILFIASGAFTGIEKLIRKRTKKSVIGFDAVDKDAAKQEEKRKHVLMGFEKKEKTEQEELMEILENDELQQKVTHKDLIEYGFLPEFVGRFPKLVSCHSLDQDALYDILTRVENSLVEQKQLLFKCDGVNLEFTEGAKRAIARVASKEKTGARSLVKIIDDALEEANYIVPGSDVTDVIVTEDVILNNESPIYIRQTAGEEATG